MLRFGPPRSFTCASTCPWLGHPVSGLLHETSRPIQARFHCAYIKKDLSLLHTITRWIVLQKARRHRINLLRLLISTWFQDLFHSPPGVLFTFPSRYLFTIDHVIYLALEGGPPRFNQGFTCPDLLDIRVRLKPKLTLRLKSYSYKSKVCFTWYTGLSPSLAELSNSFYSLSKFFTLGMTMVDHASHTEDSIAQIICMVCL